MGHVLGHPGSVNLVIQGYVEGKNCWQRQRLENVEQNWECRCTEYEAKNYHKIKGNGELYRIGSDKKEIT